MTVNCKNASVADSIPPKKSADPLQVGSLINHPARKDPMKVVEITNRGSVLVVTPRGTRYRLKMTEALKYAA